MTGEPMSNQTMDMNQLINNLTPEIHLNLKRALELGKWPDGRPLTELQKELCMEAVISYEYQHLSEEQRVGYIDRGSKAEGEMCDDNPSEELLKPLKWAD